jgi:ribosomal protein S18 acetylase RimI-like enzyme
MITFRQATIADAQTIAQLHIESWQNTYRGMMNDAYLDGDVASERVAYWQKTLGDGESGQYTLLALENDQPAGFVCVYWNDDPTHGTLIDNLHVRKHLKGRGIGTKLMQEIAKIIEEKWAESKFYLWVLEKNYDTRRFYESVGAINHEAKMYLMPDGQKHPTFRYIWKDFEVLKAKK